MALPESSRRVMRPVTISTMAIMERLGNPLTQMLLGLGNGANITDDVNALLEMVFIHNLDDEELSYIVDDVLNNPESVKKQALQWGMGKELPEIAEMVKELLIEKGRIEGSMTEPVKKEASKRKNK